MSHHTPSPPLTPKEKSFLEFIERFSLENGYPPTFIEIQKHFHYASINSVQKYVQQLQRKKYLYSPGQNQKRALQVLKPVLRLSQNPPQSSLQEVPLLGKVAAGVPLESRENEEFIEVPQSLVSGGESVFALSVEGDSMVEEGILDGDTILLSKKSYYSNGDLIVASIENEATVKRIYRHQNQIELRPSHGEMKSLWVSPQEIRIEGVVISLMRKF